MIKKFIYLIIPLIFFSFSQNVKAENIKHIEYTEPISNISFNYDLDIDKYPYYYITMRTKTDSDKKYLSFSLSYAEKKFYYNGLQVNNCGNGRSTYCYGWLKNTNGTYNTYTIDYNISNINDKIIKNSTSNQLIALYNYENWKSYVTNFNNWLSFNSPYIDGNMPILISNDLFDNSNNIVLSKEYVNNNNGYLTKPELSYTLNPIYKDGYISSYGIKVNSSIVDDTLFKYQYSIKDDTNDNLKWVDLYNNNFLNNQFSYVTKKPINFYFRILDKSNNEVIDSFTISVTFNLVSPQYEIIFNQSKFYLNGTNYIDRVGLSITYKTSIDGLKYQYQYVNDGSSLIENNWVDTENDIYKVYNVNGVLYARILDNDNNVLYSESFTNTLIGTQDILANPTNFPLYNKVQSILNFNKGTISDLVLIPVKVLMFMTDSLNRNVCNEYSFGSLLGHELKLPCIDIKSYVGNTIYNFYDLVCSFFISLGIIKLLKNIYMRFMTLEIRDIDNKGGIF